MWLLQKLQLLYSSPTSSSIASFQTSFEVDVSDQLPPHSPVMHLLARQSFLHPHCPSTSDSVFLSFSSPPHPSSSFVSLHIRHPFSWHVRTTLIFFGTRTFLDISPTFVVPLILSFRILSIFLTPHIHHNIVISATCPTSSPKLSSLRMSQPHLPYWICILPVLICFMQTSCHSPLFTNILPLTSASAYLLMHSCCHPIHTSHVICNDAQIEFVLPLWSSHDKM